MKIVNKIKNAGIKTKLLFLIILIVIVIVLFLVFRNLSNDGMKNINDASILYRVYTQDGWSKWSKNGITSGSEKGISISNIELKTKGIGSDYISFSVYNLENEWIEDNDITNSNINAIKIYIYGVAKKKYSICYRVYNPTDGWFDWSCNGEINGNKNENITKVEIKLIPKYAIKDEYLKDYGSNNKIKNLNFE